jgi:periplasmic protein TonB
MFDAFERQADPLAAKRFAASTGASLALLGLIGVAAVTFAGKQVVEKLQEPQVDVTFRPPPPPPPPPKVELPKPKPPPKVVVEKAPPPAPVAAAPAPILPPKEIPLEKPPEASAANAVAAITVASGGTGDGKGNGDPNGVPGGTGVAGVRPINLPENATPPEPLSSNADPEFPAEAKATGKEGLVILKIVVDAEGEVIQVKVMRGDEPFVTAAVSAVKTWRYKPALVEGQPTAVYRIVKVPFRIRS